MPAVSWPASDGSFVARLKREPPHSEAPPGPRAVGEYALRLAETQWVERDVNALSDAELASELRRLLREAPDTAAAGGAKVALNALDGANVKVSV